MIHTILENSQNVFFYRNLVTLREIASVSGLRVSLATIEFSHALDSAEAVGTYISRHQWDGIIFQLQTNLNNHLEVILVIGRNLADTSAVFSSWIKCVQTYGHVLYFKSTGNVCFHSVRTNFIRSKIFMMTANEVSARRRKNLHWKQTTVDGYQHFKNSTSTQKFVWHVDEFYWACYSFHMNLFRHKLLQILQSTKSKSPYEKSPLAVIKLGNIPAFQTDGSWTSLWR